MASGAQQRIAPMLAKPGTMPADDAGWAYEFKWDGVRAVAYVDGQAVTASSRGNKDFTVVFPELATLGDAADGHSMVLDGEVVAFDDGGRPSFGRLQHRLNLTSPAVVARRAAEVAATYLVFDVLVLDGESLLALPYDERRARLEGLGLNGPGLVTPPSFREAHGPDVMAAAESADLEGIMAKRRDSAYRPGERSSAWLKIKRVKAQEVVIGGWTEGEGERAGSLGALLLGVYAEDELRYAGKVGTGFDARARRDLLDKLASIEVADSPFAAGSLPKPASGTHFVLPSIVGEVNYSEWTSGGHLRHTAWRGLRVDKSPSEAVREPLPGSAS